jgi:predicted nucleic acid-binding protein
VRIAFEANVIAYAEGINDVERRDTVLALIRRVPQEAGVFPVQVLGELLNVLVRKRGRSRRDARHALLSWRDTFPVVETSPEVILVAPISRWTINLGYGMPSFSLWLRNRAAAYCCPKIFRKASLGPE